MIIILPAILYYGVYVNDFKDFLLLTNHACDIKLAASTTRGLIL